MKLVTYKKENTTDLGILINDHIYSLHQIDETLPNNMRAFLFAGAEAMNKAKQHDADLKSGKLNSTAISLADVTLLAPVNEPTSCRDGYDRRYGFLQVL